MNWRDQYLKGSFRGAAFRSQTHDRSGGRRIASTEFPGRDEPLIEDLGRKQRQFTIEAHVIGADYRAARDALVEALEAEGPGLLVHPWHGQMMVVVNDYTTSESTDDGGLCSFSLTFGEAGQPVSAPVAVPSGQAASLAADAMQATIPQEFAAKFSISGAAGFVEAAAGALISGMVEVSQIAAGLQGGVGPVLRAYDAGLRYLPANISALLRAPLNLAHSVLGLVTAVSLLGNSPRTRIAALSRLIDWQPGLTEFPDVTPSRRREADNRVALLWLFRAAAASELVRTAATAPYASYEDAAATCAAVSDRIEQLSIDAADRADDVGSEGYDRLRRALVRDISTRGETLARLYALDVLDTEPALPIANRIYGASGVSARADDIVTRNHIAHPGFIAAGKSIDLLTQTEAGLTS